MFTLPVRRCAVGARALIAMLVLAPLTSGFVQADHGDVHAWGEAGGGSFFVDGNWSPAGVPASGDVAEFSLANDLYTVTFPLTGFPPVPDPETQSVRVPHDAVRFNLVGRTYNLLSLNEPGDEPSLVLGQGSHTSGGLVVGNTGRLEIAGQGTLAGVHAVLGVDRGDDYASRGELIVADGTTADFSGDMHIGKAGEGVLEIEPGGTVVTGGRAYVGDEATGSGQVTVTGSNASWLLDGLSVGQDGEGQLLIEAGGHVRSNINSWIGNRAGASGEVTVRDSDSLWEPGNRLTVGGTNAEAALTIEDNAAVDVDGILNIRSNGTVHHNGGRLVVSDSGSTDTQADRFLVGIEDGTGEVTIRGRLLRGAAPASIARDGESVGSVTVTDQAGQFTNPGTLLVGEGGHGELRVQSGAQANSGSATISQQAGATGEASVVGTGVDDERSTWITGPINIGASGTGLLTVALRGRVFSDAVILGHEPDAAGGAAVRGILGDPSNWATTSMVLGREGHGEMLIENAGQVDSLSVNMAERSGSSAIVIARDEDSRWRVDGGLNVGGDGDAAGGEAVLDIIDSATVNVKGTVRVWDEGELDIALGGGVSATAGRLRAEELTIDGGSVTLTPHFTGLLAISDADAAAETGIGVGDGSGRLTVRGGGTLETFADVPLGRDADSFGGGTVTGSNARWDAATLDVGDAGRGRLDITDGGEVDSDTSSLGRGVEASGLANVADPGSLWTTSIMSVGRFGDGALNITDGGEVDSARAYIGQFAGATGTVAVWGDDATWTIASSLNVGGGTDIAGGEGGLAIEQGAAVEADGPLRIWDDGTVDHDGGRLVVSDSGATSEDGLFVGLGDGTGELIIRGGGRLLRDDDSGTHIGAEPDATGHVTVTGTGSRLDNGTWISVGTRGTGTLTVEDGADVVSTTGTLGWLENAAGSVIVSDSGSTWTSTMMRVGRRGDADFEVQSDARVETTSVHVGQLSTATGTVRLTDDGSSWHAQGSFNVAGDDQAAGGTATLDVEQDAALQADDALRIWDDGTFNLRGGASVDVGGLANRGAMNFDGGTLTVRAGTFQPAPAPDDLSLEAAGADADDLPTLRLVQGADSANIEHIQVGAGAAAAVEVRSGSTLSSNEATIARDPGVEASVEVADSNSAWAAGALSVGYAGDGTLTVRDEAELVSDDAWIARRPSAQGSATVRAGQWQSAELNVAADDGAVGELTIEQGGEVISTHGRIADGPVRRGASAEASTGQVTVRDDESQWMVNGPLEVAPVGTGHMQVEAGASVLSGAAVVGLFEDSEGTVELDAGTWATHGRLGVGEGGQGSVSVRAGAVVEALDAFIGAQHTGAGEVAVVGGREIGPDTPPVFVPSRLDVLESLVIAGDAAGPAGDGVLRVEDGAVVDVGDDIRVWEGGTLALDGGTVTANEVELIGGTLTGASAVEADELANAGRVAPGTPTGTLDVQGNYSQSADGRLQLALTQDAHSRIAISGAAELDGTVEVTPVDGEPLAYWQQHEILTAEQISGSFQAATLRGSAEAFVTLRHTPESVLLQLGLLGDMNLDGVVDTGDVAPFVLALTDSAAYEAEYRIDPVLVGDINQDGAFDTGDVAPFVQLLVGSDSASVPEPGSLVLLGIGGLLLLRRRRGG